MGSLFSLRVKVYEDFDAYLAEHPDRMLYPFMLDGSVPLNDAARAAGHPHTLVFGNEAAGLPAVFQTYGQSVRIPQSDEIDSLNLAVAASIAMYTFKNING